MDFKIKYFSLSFFAGAALVLLCLGGSPLGAQPSPLVVSGDQIVTNGGCTVLLRGVNTDGLEFSNNGFSGSWPGSLLSVAQMAVTGWHANVIRLPLRQDSWFGCAGADQSTYRGLVDEIVSYCSGSNVYVILDLHWSGTYSGTVATDPCSGGGWGSATGQQNMPDANAVTFWSSVASIYANNPAVLFDLYNEPHGVSWAIWRDGGSAGGSIWTPGLQVLYDAVRASGATNICIAGGLQWCQDFSGLGASALTGTGIVYAAHLYGNQVGNSTAGWAARVAPATLLAPVFVGEMGPSTSCGVDDPIYDTNLFNWIGSPGIVGGTAWSMTSNSCPNLYTGSFTPNAWGSAVQNWMLTPVPPCATATFTVTPTPTDSPTPCLVFGNTCTPTLTFTPTPTFTPTVTPTPSPTPSNLYVAYPNPWPDPASPSDTISFYFQNDQAADKVTLKIFTLAYRKVYEDGSLPVGLGPQPPLSVNVSKLNLANGLYYFVLVWKTGSQESQKVMKVLVRR